MSYWLISLLSPLQPARVIDMATERRVARTANTGFMALFLSFLGIVMDSLPVTQALDDSEDASIRYLSVRL